MNDEQLRILVATMLIAAAVEDVPDNRALGWADRLIAAARADSRPALATHTPDCQCADCLKRDARRWRMYRDQWPENFRYQGCIDKLIAAEDAKERI